jgi:hypothetical protein
VTMSASRINVLPRWLFDSDMNFHSPKTQLFNRGPNA